MSKLNAPPPPLWPLYRLDEFEIQSSDRISAVVRTRVAEFILEGVANAQDSIDDVRQQAYDDLLSQVEQAEWIIDFRDKLDQLPVDLGYGHCRFVVCPDQVTAKRWSTNLTGDIASNLAHHFEPLGSYAVLRHGRAVPSELYVGIVSDDVGRIDAHRSVPLVYLRIIYSRGIAAMVGPVVHARYAESNANPIAVLGPNTQRVLDALLTLGLTTACDFDYAREPGLELRTALPCS